MTDNVNGSIPGVVDDISAATSHAVVVDEQRDNEELAASATESSVHHDDTANAVVQNALSTNGEILQENSHGNGNRLVTAPVEWSSRRRLSNSTAAFNTATREQPNPSSGDTQATSTSTSNESSFKKNGICCGMSRWKVVTIIATLLVLVIGIVIGIVVPVRHDATSNTTGLPPDFSTTNQAILRVRTYLLQETDWSDPLSLMDPTSAQTKAVYQLALEGGQAPVQQQRYGLLVVWYGLGGGDRSSALGRQECDWNLVACNNQAQVTSLLFSKQGLDGTLLEEVALLSNLEHLDLEENTVKGQLPAALYSVTNLVTLSLGFNEFRSELSDGIGSLTKLENLRLHDNDFSGPLPDSIKSLTNLKSVELWRTNLAGPIVQYAASWPNLEVLSIAENFNINGTISSEIGTLSKLRELILQRTHISGTVPSEVGLLSNLETFGVGLYAIFDDSVTVSGTLPTEIGNCQKLRKIVIEASNMTGPIPSSIGRLTSTLKILSLSDSNFTGSIPDSLQSLTDIHEIYLANNAFSGTLPEWLGSFEEMRHLRVYWNQFTGSVPTGLCRASLKFYYDCVLECDCCGPCGPLV